MADLTRTTPSTRFSSFDIYTTAYKRIGHNNIDVSILIPKTLKPGKHPLFVKFHGGGLITGDALYPDWFANYLVNFIHRTNAIAVLPNYRLVPEHSGDDILEDVTDLWKWIDEKLAEFITPLQPSIELDFTRVLVGGDSAGGWTALHSVLMLPEGKIKAMLLQYPMTKRLPDADRPFPLGESAPPISLIDEHIASIPFQSVISSAIPPARFDLCDALAVHYNRWEERFGTGRHLHPINALEEADFFVPTLILHGAQDADVSLADCKQFVDKVGKVLGREAQNSVSLVVVDGEHGFDSELVENDTLWLKEKLEWIEQIWLS
ncbi:Alpha/Beta hydrolase protein [Pyrenochaeta sp. MPI-SDFR-AT-0127]|nr:Alpha/Beta hydrolase protein [Pyrenochaeta sp. MPI-SDFR-AT-0127]